MRTVALAVALIVIPLAIGWATRPVNSAAGEGSELTGWVGGNPDRAVGEVTSLASPTTRPSRAARHREPPSRLDQLDWEALAMCESSGNPRAVSPSGKYRGAFQADANFWRTYGGLEFAPRPDLATYHEQLIVAMRGYQARGGAPWPSCRRFLR